MKIHEAPLVDRPETCSDSREPIGSARGDDHGF